MFTKLLSKNGKRRCPLLLKIHKNDYKWRQNSLAIETLPLSLTCLGSKLDSSHLYVILRIFFLNHAKPQFSSVQNGVNYSFNIFRVL